MHLNGFFTYLQYEKRYSPHTIAAYRNDLSSFQSYLQKSGVSFHPELTDITHRQVRGWVVSMMDEKISARTVNRKICTLKSYYKFLTKRDVIRKNPMLKVISPKTDKPLPLFVEKKGMEGLFTFIEKNYPQESDTELFIKFRDKVIVELLYGTGMRRGELLGLRDNSFNLSAGMVKVLGKGNKERIIPFGKPVGKSIEEYISQRKKLFGTTDQFLLTSKGGKAYPRMIYDIIHRLLQNITTIQRKSPHVLRHTFATHLSDNGADLNAIKELLGHASLASTQVYTHNTMERLKEIHRRAHPKG